MPKSTTYPTLYDKVLTISITKLKEWGYLKPDHCKRGNIFWGTKENRELGITVLLDTTIQKPYRVKPYLELFYNYNDKAVLYRVPLISIPSNIGKGQVWYFLCPHTGKRCRKLYLAGERFLHREAFNKGLYQIQTKSAARRKMDKLFEKVFGDHKVDEQLNSKYFRTHYNGKPTKRYLKLIKEREQNQLTREQYETLESFCSQK